MMKYTMHMNVNEILMGFDVLKCLEDDEEEYKMYGTKLCGEKTQDFI